MFGFFKKKMEKDPYLEKVASILHQTIGTTLPLENAYNLAEECLHELKNNISRLRNIWYGNSLSKLNHYRSTRCIGD